MNLQEQLIDIREDGNLLAECTGFGQDRVNFLHSSWYGAMFWICDQNSIDNTGMFSLLLNSAYTESRPFMFPTLLSPSRYMDGLTAENAQTNNSSSQEVLAIGIRKQR